MCHRHGMSPGRDVTPARDVSSGILRTQSFMRQLPELSSESWCLLSSLGNPAPKAGYPFSYVVSTSQLAGRLFPVSSMRGRMPPCLRSHATIPTLPRAASQPNVYIDSAPSGAFQIQSIYYDSCTHTKFYSYEPGQRFNYFIVITLPRIQIATASTVAIDSHHVAQSTAILIAHCTSNFPHLRILRVLEHPVELRVIIAHVAIFPASPKTLSDFPTARKYSFGPTRLPVAL
jgi:hypothetical protein